MGTAATLRQRPARRRRRAPSYNIALPADKDYGCPLSILYPHEAHPHPPSRFNPAYPQPTFGQTHSAHACHLASHSTRVRGRYVFLQDGAHPNPTNQLDDMHTAFGPLLEIYAHRYFTGQNTQLGLGLVRSSSLPNIRQVYPITPVKHGQANRINAAGAAENASAVDRTSDMSKHFPFVAERVSGQLESASTGMGRPRLTAFGASGRSRVRGDADESSSYIIPNGQLVGQGLTLTGMGSQNVSAFASVSGEDASTESAVNAKFNVRIGADSAGMDGPSFTGDTSIGRRSSNAGLERTSQTLLVSVQGTSVGNSMEKLSTARAARKSTGGSGSTAKAAGPLDNQAIGQLLLEAQGIPYKADRGSMSLRTSSAVAPVTLSAAGSTLSLQPLPTNDLEALSGTSDPSALLAGVRPTESSSMVDSTADSAADSPASRVIGLEVTLQAQNAQNAANISSRGPHGTALVGTVNNRRNAQAHARTASVGLVTIGATALPDYHSNRPHHVSPTQKRGQRQPDLGAQRLLIKKPTLSAAAEGEAIHSRAPKPAQTAVFQRVVSSLLAPPHDNNGQDAHSRSTSVDSARLGRLDNFWTHYSNVRELLDSTFGGLHLTGHGSGVKSQGSGEFATNNNSGSSENVGSGKASTTRARYRSNIRNQSPLSGRVRLESDAPKELPIVLLSDILGADNSVEPEPEVPVMEAAPEKAPPEPAQRVTRRRGVSHLNDLDHGKIMNEVLQSSRVKAQIQFFQDFGRADKIDIQLREIQANPLVHVVEGHERQALSPELRKMSSGQLLRWYWNAYGYVVSLRRAAAEGGSGTERGLESLDQSKVRRLLSVFEDVKADEPARKAALLRFIATLDAPTFMLFKVVVSHLANISLLFAESLAMQLGYVFGPMLLGCGFGRLTFERSRPSDAASLVLGDSVFPVSTMAPSAPLPADERARLSAAGSKLDAVAPADSDEALMRTETRELLQRLDLDFVKAMAPDESQLALYLSGGKDADLLNVELSNGLLHLRDALSSSASSSAVDGATESRLPPLPVLPPPGQVSTTDAPDTERPASALPVADESQPTLAEPLSSHKEFVTLLVAEDVVQCPAGAVFELMLADHRAYFQFNSARGGTGR